MKCVPSGSQKPFVFRRKVEIMYIWQSFDYEWLGKNSPFDISIIYELKSPKSFHLLHMAAAALVLTNQLMDSFALDGGNTQQSPSATVVFSPLFFPPLRNSNFTTRQKNFPCFAWLISNRERTKKKKFPQNPILKLRYKRRIYDNNKKLSDFFFWLRKKLAVATQKRIFLHRNDKIEPNSNLWEIYFRVPTQYIYTIRFQRSMWIDALLSFQAYFMHVQERVCLSGVGWIIRKKYCWLHWCRETRPFWNITH